jgi:choice-of-anchor A domain-containing protein
MVNSARDPGEGSNRGKGRFGTDFVSAARDAAVGRQRAGKVHAGGNLGECASWRSRFPTEVITPTSNAPFSPQPTDVAKAGGDLGEKSAIRRIQRSLRVTTPASDAAIGNLALSVGPETLPSLSQNDPSLRIPPLYNEASKIGGFVSSAKSAYDFGQKALQYLGVLDNPLSLDDIKAEMELIAAYQDWQTAQNSINEAYKQATLASNILTSKSDYVKNGTFYQAYPWDQPGLGEDLFNFTSGAVAEILSQGSGGAFRECSRLPLFQRRGSSSSQLTYYDWRAGMAPAMSVVALRLLAIAIMDPTFKTDGVFVPELNDIKSCLQEHLNLIHPPKPARFCKWGGQSFCDQLECSESRSWAAWKVTPSIMPFPLCKDYVASSSPSTLVAFEDLEAIAGSALDNSDLAPVLGLKRMINTIARITSQQPDLAEKSHLIPFGANPSLCLSLKADQATPILDNCSSGSPYLSWNYDRVSRALTNVSTGKCMQISGVLTAASPTSSAYVTTCADPNIDGVVPAQEFNWNPESGLIENPLGPVLAVTNSVPQAGSLVSGVPANSWHLNQQVWTNAVASSCTGAICPVTGMAAWTQSDWGKVTNPPSQRYPEDFSVFSYLSASGMYDVQGPVAANGRGYGMALSDSAGHEYGGIAMQSFGLNRPNPPGSNFPGMPVGLVAGVGANVNLSNGSAGGLLYVGPSIDPWALGDTWDSYPLNKTIPTSVTLGIKGNNPIQMSPINFEMAFLKLQALSTSLSGSLATGTVTRPPSPYGVMTLTSTNPTIAVFSLKASDLYQVGTIQFNVPATATILINVSGTQVSIANLGFSGTTRGSSSILWNFYQAQSVAVGSLSLPGSVLAPFAHASFYWGLVAGTVAAWDIDATSEFHWFPFHNNALIPGP